MKKILCVVIVFLFCSTCMALELVRQKNVATYITFPLIDSTTTTALQSGATAPDSEIDAFGDGAAPDGFADCTNEATEIGATGIYYLSLAQAEMNADYITIQIKASDALTQVILIRTITGDPLLAATTDDGGTINVTGGKVDGVVLVDTTTTNTDLAAHDAKLDTASAAATAAKTAAEKIDTNTELRTLLFGSDTPGATATALATAQADLDLYDTDAEHAAAHWGADATTYQAQGTFGQAIGDPGLDASTIWGLANSYLDEAISGIDDNPWDAAARTLTALDEDTTTIDLDASAVGSVTTKTGYELADGAITAAKIATAAFTNDELDDTFIDEIIEELFSYDATLAYATATAGSLVTEVADNAGGASLSLVDIAQAVMDLWVSDGLVETDGAAKRFTRNALEMAPRRGGI